MATASPVEHKSYKTFKFPELIVERRLPEPMAAAPVTNVSTNGWDTVYAIQLASVNNAIAKQTTPMTVNQSDTAGTNPASIQCTLNPWQLATGGSGGTLDLVATITSGTASFQNVNYTLDGTQVAFNVQLVFIPQPPSAPTPAPAAPLPTTRKELRVKTGKHHTRGTMAPTGPVMAPTTPIVSVTDLTGFLEGQEPPLDAKFVFTGLLQLWFNANLQQFNQVFAAVTVNNVADTGPFAWLKPHDVGYAYTDTSDGSGGIFAVLATTADRVSQGLAKSVPPSAIPTGATSGFLIASARLLSDIVLPAVPSAFTNAKPTDFEVVSDSLLDNMNPITLTFQKDSTTYTGAIDAKKFTVTVNGTQLVIAISQMSVGISDGISVKIDMAEYLQVTTQKKNDGTNVLWFNKTDGTVNHTVVMEDWVTGVTIGANVVGGLIGAIFGFAAFQEVLIRQTWSQVVKVIVAVVLSIVVGGVINVLANIAYYIQLANDQKFNDLPSLESMVANGIGTVEWPNTSGYTLVSAGLAQSLQLGLKLT